MSNKTNNQPYPDNSQRVETMAAPQFSFYNRPVKNTTPSKTMTLLDAYHDIKSYRNQPQTAILRTFADQNQAKAYKAQWFDYVTFSGTFTRRSAQELIQHSGLMVLDIDHLEEVDSLRQSLINDLELKVELLFASPSGNGLKCVVAIDTKAASHLEWFLAITEYFKHTYNVTLDPSGKDVPRACFLPYDSSVYINPKYLLPC